MSTGELFNGVRKESVVTIFLVASGIFSILSG